MKPTSTRTAEDPTRPILLVHGFGSCPRVMSPIARSLRRSLKRHVVAVPLCPGRADLRESARELERALGRLAASDDFESADLVAHSMGGLTATYLLKALDLGRCVRTVVTLGTPHRGTPLARLGALIVGAASRAVWQMLPGCEFLEALEGMETPAGSQLVSIAGERDRLVPIASTRLPSGPEHRNLVLPEVGHTDLLLRRGVFARVAEVLGEAAVACPPLRRAPGTASLAA